MHYKTLYSILTFIIPLLVSAQCWEPQSTPTTAQLHATHFTDVQTGWAGGANGTLLHTTDGGENWSAQSSGVNDMLYDLYFTDSNTGWTIGSRGTILKTTNGGSSWSVQNAGTDTDLYGIYMANATEGWITGACGLLLRTTNGGSSWQQQSSGLDYHLYDVAFNGALGIATGSNGTVLRSTDGGNSWQNGFTSGSGNWRGLAVRGNSFVIANTDGEIGLVNANATGYTPVNTPAGSWQGIAAATEQDWYLCGRNGTLLRTTDAGSTWTSESTNTNADLYGISVIPGADAWATGSAGTIVSACSSDPPPGGGGGTVGTDCWALQSTPTTAQLRATHFTDAQTGWACGANGTLLHTTDGGENWAAQSSGVNTLLYDVFFTDGSTGWAVGSQGAILHTTNGGSSWSAQDAGTASDLYGLYMANANEGWIAGACGLLLHTTDGGATWQQQSSGLSYHLYDVAFNGSLGLATGSNGTVLRSTDGGNSWQSGFTSGSGNWRGLAVQGSSFVIANTDGEVGVVNANGTGYTPMSMPVAGRWQSIAVVTDDIWYVAGLDGTVLRTEDAGSSWITEDAGTNADWYGLFFTDANNGWAVGSQGTIVNICPAVNLNCDRPQDSLALVALYNTHNGSSWTFNSANTYEAPIVSTPIPNAGNEWDFNQPIDTWHGVVLNSEGCVEKLIINGLGITGDLPDIQLNNAKELYCYDNNFSGSIPDFTNLPQLKIFSCHRNMLNGSIPDFNTIPNLEVFICNDNVLEGELPDFSNLPILNFFYCFNNELSGDLPNFSGLPALEVFNLGNNSFTGAIPEFTGMESLESFQAFFNDFSGALPSFSNCPNLKSVNLTHNALSGLVPNYSQYCPGLRRFYHNNNQFTFKDIIPHFSENDNLINSNATFNGDSLRYAPQDSIFADTLIISPTGSELIIDLGIDEGVTDNVYQWYKDEQLYNTITGNNTLEFPSLQESDAGTYWVHITNPGVPDLTLESYEITVEVQQNGSSPEMIYIEGGVFEMGCTEEQISCTSGENPIQPTSVSSFWMGQYEVTQSEWITIIGDNPSVFDACGVDCPATNVSWYDVLTFCNRLSLQNNYEPCYYFDEDYTVVFDSLIGDTFLTDPIIMVYWKKDADGFRLPTEAEWEYCARSKGAIPQFLFSGSDDPDEVAWFNSNSFVSYSGSSNGRGIHPVGMKLSNGVGLYDMSGNVGEWCWDWFDDSYYQSSLRCNPTGASLGDSKIVRGGHWGSSGTFDLRVASRYTSLIPTVRSYSTGLRLARGPVGSNQCICDPVQDSLALVALYNATDGPNWTNSWDLNQPVATWNGVVFDAAGDCITALVLDNNNLNGNLPDPLPLTRLQNLVLTNNPELTGALPNFEFLPALEFVALFENGFSGSIPENINLPELFHLDVSDNQLSGEIPDFTGTPNLQYLDLRNNQLSGAIPDLSHLSQLYYWSLFINNFETPIPDLSVYPSLDTFSIANNGLTFEDILPTHDASTGALNFFDYSAQDSIYQDTLIEAVAGTNFEIDLGIDPGISNNNYLWYRDDDVDVAFNSNTRQFNNVSVQDEGVYRVEVTNPGAPNLALYSRNIEVRVCPAAVQLDTVLCAGSNLSIGGDTYNENNPTGTATFTAANGCDSIINVSLSFLPSIENTISDLICDGESYFFNGQNLTSTGTYDAIFTAANGCDSTVILNLQVAPPLGIVGAPNTEYQVCENEPLPTLTLNPTTGATIDWYDAPSGGNLLQQGSNSYTPSAPGTYFAEVRQTITGCTSLQRLMVSVAQSPVLTTQLETTTCIPDEAGLDTVVLTATFGCDSLVVTNTTYIPPAEPTVLTATTCLEGEVGSDTLLLQTTEGCDSLVITNTTLTSPPAPTILNLTTCLESEVGSDTLVLQTSEGCDSLVITTITYQPAGPPTFVETTTCLESEAGMDTLLLQDAQGCDSLIILTTIYENIPLTQVAETTCDWETVGTDIQVFTTAEGCDSVVQYQYTFEPALITALPDAASCDEAEWGTDTTFLTTAGGCDSLLIQETLPAPPAETVLDTQICAGESLLFGSQLIESEGAYFDTLFTVAGCDSIITLNVAVTSDAPVPITEYLCPGDTILFGGNLIAGPGQFTETFTDQFGCDSTIQLTVESIGAEAFSLTPDEQIILEGNTSATFSLTDNDQLPPDYTLELTQMPLHGTANISDEGELTYELTNTSFLGVDSFSYRACTQLCIDTCIEASIRISTLADCLTEIQANLPTGFTPDGDGFNDELHPLREVIDVGCLQGPERATMRVLNRWGEVVFEADPYRSWDGRYTNGQIVPQGTYYYILTFELDGENVITQYVHVLRTE